MVFITFLGQDSDINVKFHKEQEFDAWRWINYWEPIEQVINFKHDVYEAALAELAGYINLSNTTENTKESSSNVTPK